MTRNEANLTDYNKMTRPFNKTVPAGLSRSISSPFCIVSIVLTLEAVYCYYYHQFILK